MKTAPHKEVVVIGLGWTGAIMAMELAEKGLSVLALERGQDRATVPDFQYPKVIDELKYGVRYGFMQKPRQSTVTVRRNLTEVALPYRVLGSFLPGDGVGGAGMHWNGLNWRLQEEEMRLRSYTQENFGAQVIPEGMLLADYPLSYQELEPYFDKFERVAGISGQAGNLNGKVIDGGNPFEAPRSRDYPMPAMAQTYDGMQFAETAKKMGYHPFPKPCGIASTSYVNDYGMQMGPCNFCGFCERFGCYNYSKSSPQTSILDALNRKPNFEYKTQTEVLKIELAADGKTAKGVTYFDANTGETVFQPADIVLLCAYQLHNVHLLLLSGIGTPYNPDTGEGTVGRGYSYQMNGGVRLFYKDKDFNWFIGTGGNGMSIDDFGVNQIDFAKEGFIGGSYISAGTFNGQPIRTMPLPPGTPAWGKQWKQAIGQWYSRSMSIGSHGTCMAYKTNYLDLDPTYKDPHGRPLLRMTFNWQDNDIRMTQFMKGKMEEIARAMNPDIMQSSFKDFGAQYDVRPYQTTHNVGGNAMGFSPEDSVINRFSQSWDVHNVFVLGAGAFPQNTQYNPTGMVGALAYWTAKAIVDQYLADPRQLV